MRVNKLKLYLDRPEDLQFTYWDFSQSLVGIAFSLKELIHSLGAIVDPWITKCRDGQEDLGRQKEICYMAVLKKTNQFLEQYEEDGREDGRRWSPSNICLVH